MEDFKNRLKKELDGVKKGFVVLIISESEKYAEVNNYILETMIKGSSCIYVSLNKPVQNIINQLKDKKINTNKIFFIDCVTKLVGGKEIKSENIKMTEPGNLTGISIAINTFVDTIKGEKCIIFDSLATLLIYNSMGSIEKFSHYITNRIRVNYLKGVLLSIEGDAEKGIINLLERCSDKIIKI